MKKNEIFRKMRGLGVYNINQGHIKLKKILMFSLMWKLNCNVSMYVCKQL